MKKKNRIKKPPATSEEAQTAERAEAKMMGRDMIPAAVKNFAQLPSLISFGVAITALIISMFLFLEQRQAAKRLANAENLATDTPIAATAADLAAFKTRILSEIAQIKIDLETIAASQGRGQGQGGNAETLRTEIENLRIRIDALGDRIGNTGGAQSQNREPTPNADEPDIAEKPWWSFFGNGLKITRIDEDEGN